MPLILSGSRNDADDTGIGALQGRLPRDRRDADRKSGHVADISHRAMLVSQMLKYARALLATGWCQGAEARDENGEPVAPWDELAVSWSLRGALAAVTHDAEADAVALGLGLLALALALHVPTDELRAWNDDRRGTERDVIAAYDDALELLPALVERYDRA